MGRLQSYIIEQISNLDVTKKDIRSAVEIALQWAVLYFETSEVTADKILVEPPQHISVSVYWQDSPNVLIEMGSVGYLKECQPYFLLLGQGIAGRLFQDEDKTELNVPSLRRDQGWKAVFDSGNDQISQSSCAMVMRFGTERRGVLQFSSPIEDYFREGDLDFIKALAPLVFFIVQSLTLKERERQIETMTRISSKIRRMTEFAEVSQAVLQEIVSFFWHGEAHTGGCLYWIEEDALVLIAQEELSTVFPHNLTKEMDNLPSFLRKALLGESYISHTDVTITADWRNNVAEGINSVLSYPITERDNVVAVLYLESDHHDIFSHKIISFLKEITNQITIVKEMIDYRERDRIKNTLTGTLEYMDLFSYGIQHQIGNTILAAQTKLRSLSMRLAKLTATQDVADFQDIISTIKSHNDMIVRETTRYREMFQNTPEKPRHYTVMIGLQVADIEAKTWIELLKKQFLITYECDDKLMIKGDDKLTSVFKELMINSVKYMDKTLGHLHIKCYRVGNWVKIIFHDNGAGFPPETGERLFKGRNRLVHTKDMAPGTGWGLPSVRLILRSLDGDITASSEGIGLGATFTLTLPAWGTTGKLTTQQTSK